VRAAFELTGPRASPRELAIVLAAVGLASNLAALRALASRASSTVTCGCTPAAWPEAPHD
jgi:hydroxymethylglutaryl-CoA reductase